ncbi:RagB/SusD family nutrient uptake outer membrane protein [Tunicatimonas pelagia]|uniref:RagB/SusD family nutrient uptake outer membrane protein n=1 Tax=Tunicatimonas pelagia TaxID=931531 RepID=UPI00266672D5|nr:RagB/SusD family nutrient uptake outer membrane protein [Tunicatimonas pelagia]WKN40782.1 RagB/SusD family nutrient uptake outer membrane protein [Tunicatimonas pelagia]
MNTIYKGFLLAAGLWMFTACEIEEVIEDELTAEEVFATPGGAQQLVAPIYASVRDLMKQDGVYGVNEHTSDEMLGPTRGTDWDDNGVWRVLHTHTWDANNLYIRNSWNDLNRGVSRANSALSVLLQAENTPENRRLIAEARTLHAMFSLFVIDMFGQLPFREFDDTDFTSPGQVLNRQEGFDFIEEQLELALPDLGAKSDVPYGRMTTSSAQTLLMVLNLNHEVLLGQRDDDRFRRVATLADEIINSGEYSLATDYFAIFNNDNTETQGQNEAIIISEFNDSEDLAVNNQLFVNMTLHYNQRWGQNNEFSAWNGFTTIADFYNRFDQNDPRFSDSTYAVSGIPRGFLEGQQFTETGEFILERGANSITVESPDNPPAPLLSYTLDVSLTGNSESNGVRVIKYQPDNDSPQQGRADYDYILWRLGDVYLMKAEALWRVGDIAPATAAIDELRAARGLAPVGVIDEDVILNERGYELYWEGHRRRDLIRFDRYNSAYTLKDQSPEFRQLFPIPQTAIDSDPNLEQNDGYTGG